MAIKAADDIDEARKAEEARPIGLKRGLSQKITDEESRAYFTPRSSRHATAQLKVKPVAAQINFSGTKLWSGYFSNPARR